MGPEEWRERIEAVENGVEEEEEEEVEAYGELEHVPFVLQFEFSRETKVDVDYLWDVSRVVMGAAKGFFAATLGSEEFVCVALLGYNVDSKKRPYKTARLQFPYMRATHEQLRELRERSIEQLKKKCKGVRWTTVIAPHPDVLHKYCGQMASEERRLWSYISEDREGVDDIANVLFLGNHPEAEGAWEGDEWCCLPVYLSPLYGYELQPMIKLEIKSKLVSSPGASRLLDAVYRQTLDAAHVATHFAAAIKEEQDFVLDLMNRNSPKHYRWSESRRLWVPKQADLLRTWVKESALKWYLELQQPGLPEDLIKNAKVAYRGVTSRGVSIIVNTMLDDLLADDDYVDRMREARERLDSQRHLVPCLDGSVFDCTLVDGASVGFRDRTRDDFFTQCENVQQTDLGDEENAEPLEFVTRFLRDFTCRDAEYESYLLKLIFYFCTGYVSRDEFYIMYGDGSNGKSLLNDVISKMVGNFHERMEGDAFVPHANRGGGKSTTEFNGLVGKRFASAPELGDAQVLDAPSIKRHTGESTINMRRLNEEQTAVTIYHKIVIHTNSLPVLTSCDYAIIRRTRALPCNARFIKDTETAKPGDIRIDARMKEMMMSQRCLNCLFTLASRIFGDFAVNTSEPLPGVVTQLTDQYITTSDRYTDFIASALTPVESGRIGAADLYKCFRSWWMTNGNNSRATPCPSNTEFGTKISKKLAFVGGGSKKKTYIGYVVMDDDITDEVMSTCIKRVSHEPR